MTLENDKDLEKAKREHAVKGEVENLKLTVCTIQTEIGGKGRVPNRSMKRKLDLQAPSSSVKPETMRSKSTEDSESEDEDRFMMYLKNEASKLDQKKKDGNSKWNDYHIELIRFLEKKGTKSRCSAEHLVLWSNLLYEGRLSGPQEEPNWDQYASQLNSPPLPPANSSLFANRRNSANSDILTVLFARQDQLRKDERREQRLHQEQQ